MLPNQFNGILVYFGIQLWEAMRSLGLEFAAGVYVIYQVLKDAWA